MLRSLSKWTLKKGPKMPCSWRPRQANGKTMNRTKGAKDVSTLAVNGCTFEIVLNLLSVIICASCVLLRSSSTVYLNIFSETAVEKVIKVCTVVPYEIRY